MELNLLHLYMELLAAACLFFIAGINIVYNATGQYSKLMALGTSIAAITDLTHCLVPMAFPSMTEHWMLLSWGASRITLVLMFMMVFLCYDVIKCRLKNLAVILITPLLFSILIAASQVMGVGHFELHPHNFLLFDTIYINTMDFVLLILWLIITILLRHKARILFPPYVYWLFMSQGIMVHAIIAFASAGTLDIPAFLAHALKISEYYSFVLIYLLYRAHYHDIPQEIRNSAASKINNSNLSKKMTPHASEIIKGN